MSAKLEKFDLVSLSEAIENPPIPKGTIGQVVDVTDEDTVRVEFKSGHHEPIGTCSVSMEKLYIFKHHTTLTDDDFWKIIEDSQTQSIGDEVVFIETITNRLVQETIPNLYKFDEILIHYHDKAFTSDLWAAGYIINSGCSDDGFTDFRAWLIAQGKAVYEAALKDPETLVDVAPVIETDYGPQGLADLESMNYVAYYAYRKKVGGEMPVVSHERHIKFDGFNWTEDTVYDLYPRLAAKFSDMLDD